MKYMSFKCNALIESSKPNVVVSKLFSDIVSTRNIMNNAERIGNWINGTVHLKNTHLVFTTNTQNAFFQEVSDFFIVPYSEIRSAELRKMLWVAKTVNVKAQSGLVRFRCHGSSNDLLLREIQARVQLQEELA